MPDLLTRVLDARGVARAKERREGSLRAADDVGTARGRGRVEVGVREEVRALPVKGNLRIREVRSDPPYKSFHDEVLDRWA